VSIDLTRSISEVLPAEALDLTVDAGLGRALGVEPETAVAPGSVSEIVAVLQWAGEAGVAVVPVGTGAHVNPRRPSGAYIALTARRLSSVEIYEPDDLTMTAGAGALVRDLSREMDPHRQWLPFDPPDVQNRTLGGLAASGLTGPLSAAYGPIRNHVLGATVVCGDGRVLRLGGRVVKNVAGFDVLKPVVGSRGDLAVITSVTVRLFPVPAVDRVLMLDAPDVAELVAAARATATAPILPASIVLTSGAGSARLLVRLHGAAATVDAEQRRLEIHAGVAFQAADGTDGMDVALAARDSGLGAGVRVRLWALPSRLGELLDLATAVPDASTLADACGGSVTVSVPEVGPDAEATFAELRAEVEALGGGTRALQLPSDLDPAAINSEASRAEAELAGRVRFAFDPDNALWGTP
jgi:glycolate oxidase FAD binding subunit